MRRFLLLLVLVFATCPLPAQHLVRKGFIGIQPTPLDVKSAASLGLKEPEGILIIAVLPESTAAKTGIRIKDVLLQLNGKNILNVPQLMEPPRTY